MKQETNVETSLNFKEQTPFFEKFFEIRQNFINGLSEANFVNDSKVFVNLFKDLNTLVDWTDSYIRNDNIFIEIDKLKKMIIMHSKNHNEVYADNLLQQFKKILKLINREHERHELLPKVVVEEVDPIKLEKDDMVRDAMYAFRLLYKNEQSISDK